MDAVQTMGLSRQFATESAAAEIAHQDQPGDCPVRPEQNAHLSAGLPLILGVAAGRRNRQHRQNQRRADADQIHDALTGHQLFAGNIFQPQQRQPRQRQFLQMLCPGALGSPVGIGIRISPGDAVCPDVPQFHAGDNCDSQREQQQQRTGVLPVEQRRFPIQQPFQEQPCQDRQRKDRHRSDLVGAAKHEKQDQRNKCQNGMHPYFPGLLMHCHQILQPEQQRQSAEQEQDAQAIIDGMSPEDLPELFAGA